MIQMVLHSIVTFIDIAALSMLVGVALCLFWMSRPEGDEDVSRLFAGRLRRLLMLCLIVLVISSISNLIQRTMEMSGLGIAAVPPLLPAVLFKTHYGKIGLLRAGGIGLALAIWFIGRRHLNSHFVAVILFCASAAIAFSRSATSHAADFGDLSLQELSDWFHLIASSLWGGTLIAVAIVFRPSLATGDNRQNTVISGIADRFYVLFGPVFSLLVISGLYNAWVEVGSFGLLVTTPYGRLLSAKIVLLIFLTLRYIAPPQHGQDESAFIVKFLRRTRVEAIVIVVVLLCAAMLTHNIPARHFMHLEHAMTMGSHAGHEQGQHDRYAPTEPEAVVHLETPPKDIKAGTPVAITVHIEDQNGRPFTGLIVHHERILHTIIIGSDLNVFAHIHTEDIGPVTSKMLKEATFPFRFTFPKAGEYLVGLDFATANGLYSKTAYAKVSGQPKMGEPKLDFSTERDFGAYHVTLKISPDSIKAGGETTLRYLIKKNEKPVTDLSPYLGAPMHLAIVLADLKQFIHAHGESQTHMDHMHMHAEPGEKFGPEIESVVVFPVKGVYKIFSQVNHQGKVLLFDFMVKVQ
jgi:putative copper resistance protein D